MKSIKIASYLFFGVLMLFPVLSQASAYWMEIKENRHLNAPVNIELVYGNIDELGIRHRQTGKELLLAGAFTFQLFSPKGSITQLKMVQKSDCWQMNFLPTENGEYRIVGINCTHPVVDRSASGGENILPIDYLCGQYLIGTASPQGKPVQFLDLLVQQQGKTINIKAFRDKKREQAKTKLRVFNPENWEKELILNENGEAVFSATMEGMYNIRMDWSDLKSGNFKGVAYTSIRHRCNFCLFIE
ncbi:hypothetical protein GJU39_16065 [Pedobacter petrophilus]|uniref:DUF4198 domain-containing protein n=1 Tax=Pedobacter petrophilus TaxID=1908241 RepID=A0A7K0G2K2_9SPHI|nr:hypothetical protein [Pedobacter petrophilus]MRX77604.1 hypothetical protein [Pedobacter petrophilus]